LITFIIVGVTSYGVTNVVSNTESTTVCADLEWSHLVSTLENDGYLSLCKMGGCQCYFEDPEVWPQGYLYKNELFYVSN